MKKNGKKISTEYVALLGGILLGVAFLLLDFLGAVSFLRAGISFAMDPDEYNELTIQVYEQEVESSFYALLKEENESLKKQIALGDLEQKYVMAKILGGIEEDFLRINKGRKDGVAVGDVVSLGHMYVGLIVRVDLQGALVRLATNKASNLEVVVVSGDLDLLRKIKDVKVLTKGIVKGSSDGIKVENMSMNASLQNGDIVVVNDPRVGQYLILGYLVGLSENPAATSRSGYVSPILDYDKLITVFVKTDI